MNQHYCKYMLLVQDDNKNSEHVHVSDVYNYNIKAIVT